jgi:outer membrane receptor protein involved in Fe transport
LLNPVVSDFEATSIALFGQVHLALGEQLDLTVGLRSERRNADYGDSSGHAFAPEDDMLGGEVALAWRLDDRRSAYAKLARGYKAGGFNVSLADADFDVVDKLSPAHIQYGPETLVSVEGGYRAAFAAAAVRAEASLFWARREDQQIKVPLQLTRGDPSSFLFVTANAGRGEHYGLEATVDWRASERLELSAALGWLETEIVDFDLFTSLEGRAQAHAPRYTYSIAAEYRAGRGWWGRLDLGGMDEFFYDYGHDLESEAYAVANLRLGREWGPWKATLWVRNLLDEEYFVRGFFFGNEPPDFPNALYTRLADPRHYGVTVSFGL